MISLVLFLESIYTINRYYNPLTSSMTIALFRGYTLMLNEKLIGSGPFRGPIKDEASLGLFS